MSVNVLDEKATTAIKFDKEASLVYDPLGGFSLGFRIPRRFN